MTYDITMWFIRRWDVKERIDNIHMDQREAHLFDEVTKRYVLGRPLARSKKLLSTTLYQMIIKN